MGEDISVLPRSNTSGRTLSDWDLLVERMTGKTLGLAFAMVTYGSAIEPKIRSPISRMSDLV